MAQNSRHNAGQADKSPVTQALLSLLSAWIGVGLLSLFVNILMLTGPLYMLQVYDRVLTSQSLSTLIALSILMLLMYLFMGAMDFLRARILVRLGNYVETQLAGRTFKSWLRHGLEGPAALKLRPLQDLRLISQFLRGPAPVTFFDIPFTPIYIAVIFLLHPLLGWFAIFGAIIVLIIALTAERATRHPQAQSQKFTSGGDSFSESCHRHAETVMSMGMAHDLGRRWVDTKDQGTQLSLKASDIAGGSTAFSKAFRMFLQSAILGLGAWLAVQQIVTPGIMIAGSIILGRALAPIQMVIGQWRNYIQAKNAYIRINKFYTDYTNQDEFVPLPSPKGYLAVDGLSAGPPHAKSATLKGIQFNIDPGDGLIVLGPSGSGKSTLARLLVGVWMPQIGSVRLDGATYDQWDRELLGQHIGYLPQQITLFDGTIGDNIARFRKDLPGTEIVKAAQAAGVHELILGLPDGYNTLIGTGGTVLSVGQTQRIALARALYGTPCLVVLDEPNSNLDSSGDEALNKAIIGLRKQGSTVIIISHRQSVMAVANKALVLRDGTQAGFGLSKDLIQQKASEAALGAPVKSGQSPNAISSPSPANLNPTKQPDKNPKTSSQSSQSSNSRGFSGVMAAPNLSLKKTAGTPASNTPKPTTPNKDK